MGEELITIVYYWQDPQDQHCWRFDTKPPIGMEYRSQEMPRPMTFEEACDQVTVMWQP